MGYGELGYRGISGRFFSRLIAAEAGSWMSRVAMRFGSDQEVETYKWLGMPSQFREWVGGRHQRKLRVEAYTLRNKRYEDTLVLPVEDLRRDKTAQIMARVDDMSVRAGQHWEALGSTVIEAGETALCYDGQAFFDTDHVSGDSGTLTNDLTATQVPSADVVLNTAPTAAEIANIIVETISYMMRYVDDAGEPINQNAQDFVVMVPIPFYAPLLTALSSQFLGAGVSNPLEGVKAKAGWSITPVANPRLSWTTKLAIFRTDGSMKPIIMQDELAIQASYIGAGSEEEFKNDAHLFGLKAVRAVGYGLWQHAALVTLSTAS